MNLSDNPVSVATYFLCEECLDQERGWWEDHNKGRVEEYLIETAKINVDAETREEFREKVAPHVYSQIDSWVPKSDLRDVKWEKVKTKK